MITNEHNIFFSADECFEIRYGYGLATLNKLKNLGIF